MRRRERRVRGDRGGAAVAVLRGGRVRRRGRAGRADRLRPPAPGGVADAGARDQRRGPARARAGRLEGRGPERGVPGLRRCDGAGRHVGPGRLQPKRPGLRRERERDRRDRDVQLRLRRDRHPRPEPGARRRSRDGLAGEHGRLPDRRRAGLLGHGARPVLPVGNPQLRPHGRERRVPGRGRGRVPPGQGRHEARHPERRGIVRPRRRGERARRRGCARDRGRRLRRLGSEGVELRGSLPQDRAGGRERRLPGRGDRRERRPGDPRQGRRARGPTRRPRTTASC